MAEPISVILGAHVLAFFNAATAEQMALFASVGVTPEVAAKIVQARSALPEVRFATVTDLNAVLPAPVSAMEKHAGKLMWNDVPALLLPVRLETRFRGTELWVRIYPDTISVDTHDLRLTQAELDAGNAYWQAATTPDDSKGAWRALVAKVGSERAAYIVRTVPPPSSSASQPLTRPDSRGWFTQPRLKALPDRFCLYLYRVGQPVIVKEGQPIKVALATLADPDPVLGAAGMLEGDAKWIVDFATAEQCGMAIRVTGLTAVDLQNGFSQVIVVGLRTQGADEGLKAWLALLDAHHYSNGAAFAKYGTPTNNTTRAGAGLSLSVDDAEHSYKVEIEDPSRWKESAPDPETNAHRLQSALGIGRTDTTLRHLEHAADGTGTEDYCTRQMHTALWPVTGGYVLQHLLPGMVSPGHQARLAAHFRDYVRGLGPLPALRVADQPYGVLPVTRIAGFKAALEDNVEQFADSASKAVGVAFDTALHRALLGLLSPWLSWVNNSRRVPRIAPTSPDGDPDKALLQVLSMQPQSRSHVLRPFIDERFVGWLLAATRDQMFGPGTPYETSTTTPIGWVQQWANEWTKARTTQAKLWSKWTGGATAAFNAAPLLHLIAWWQAADLQVDLGIPLAGDGASDVPAAYLRQVVDKTSTSATLLNELLQRALQLTGDAADVSTAIGLLATVAEGDKAADVDFDRLLREVLDVCHNRLDAWLTSFATKRLLGMRSSRSLGLYLGAFGYVENLKPDTARTSQGYIHAPSSPQAAAAAVMHNAYQTHVDPSAPAKANPFRLNLSSERVRLALEILQGVRQGQSLGVLLGYQFERSLHEQQLDALIDDFRSAFPLVAHKETVSTGGEITLAMAARNVLDGLTLVRWAEGASPSELTLGDSQAMQNISTRIANSTVAAAIDRLRNAFDAISDLLMYEGVYQTVQGNFDRAAAAIETLSGAASPPAQFDSIVTPVRGKTLGQRVCLLLRSATAPAGAGPRTALEPRLAAWVADLFGDLGDIGVTCRLGARTRIVRLAELQIEPIDLIFMANATLANGDTEVEARIRYRVRSIEQQRYDQAVVIDPSRPKDCRYGLDEALELARHAIELLRAGRPLRSDSVCLPDEAVADSYTAADADELNTRIDAAIAAAKRLFDPIPSSSAEQGALLLKLNCCGLRDVIPAGADAPDVDKLFQQARAELGRRITAASTLQTESQQLTPSPRVRRLMDAAAQLCGPNALVLPCFTPANRAQLVATLGRHELLLGPGLGEQRIRQWLQQSSMVRQPLALLDDLMMMSEAWRQANPARAALPALSLSLGQLAASDSGRWLGLDKDERGASIHVDFASARGVVSLVVATNETAPTVPDRLAGLLLDQWEEDIPSGDVDTGVAFQFNAPNAQAPQSLLLAVPAERRAGVLWNTAELAAIVKDTIDLAKIRLVDADAMSEVVGEVNAVGTGAALPALMLPVDPSNPGWGRAAFATTIDEWVANLETVSPRCIHGRVSGKTLTANDGTIWTLEPDPEFPLNDYAPGLGSSEVALSTDVEVRGNAGEASRRLYVRDFQVLDHSQALQAITFTGTVRVVTNAYGTTYSLTNAPTASFYSLFGGLAAELKSLNGCQVTVQGSLYPSQRIYINRYDMRGIPGNTSVAPAAIGILQQGFEGLFLFDLDRRYWGVRGSSQVLQAMRAVMDSKIWVAGTKGTSASPSGTVTSADGPIITVTSFGVLRPRAAIIPC